MNPVRQVTTFQVEPQTFYTRILLYTQFIVSLYPWLVHLPLLESSLSCYYLVDLWMPYDTQIYIFGYQKVDNSHFNVALFSKVGSCGVIINVVLRLSYLFSMQKELTVFSGITVKACWKYVISRCSGSDCIIEVMSLRVRRWDDCRIRSTVGHSNYGSFND